MRLGNFTLVSGGSGVSCVKTVSGTQETSFSLGIMVRIAGLEPARLAALPPQSSVSANSTISANRRKLQHATAWTQVHSGLHNSMKLLRQRPGRRQIFSRIPTQITASI